MLKKNSIKIILIITIGIIVFNSLIVVTEWFALSPRGNTVILFLPIVLVLPLMLAFLLLPISLICLLFKKIRQTALIIFISSTLYFGITLSILKVGRYVRTQAFYNLADRSTPLIKSIYQYNKDKGHPPETLEDLIPDYISKIPATGMGAYPDYRYELVEDPKDWDENPWVVYVNTPRGLLNWDMFMYFPKQNYPKHGYSGSLERIKDWAYVHE